jgi:hypothetical protein
MDFSHRIVEKFNIPSAVPYKEIMADKLERMNSLSLNQKIVICLTYMLLTVLTSDFGAFSSDFVKTTR